MRKIAFIFFLHISFLVMSQEDAYRTMLNILYSHSVPLINNVEVKNLLESKEKTILLDIRTKEEYNVSHIKGAELIDYDTFDDSLLSKYDKNAQIIVYCSVGYRSEKIGEHFIDNGFNNVYNIYGGIFEWVNENNTVVNTNNKPTDEIHAYSPEWSIWLKKGKKVYE